MVESCRLDAKRVAPDTEATLMTSHERSPSVGGRAQTREWAIRILTIIGGPLLLLSGLELALRGLGYGHDSRFFIPDTQRGYYRTNPHFTHLFFPETFGLKPENFRLPRKKPAGTLRVFVLGESAAMGVPEPGFGLVPHLRAQLQARHADRRIEVYNLGITAINSHVIRYLANEAKRFDPDMFVLYMGNNEFVGPFGASRQEPAARLSRPVIRAIIAVRGTRSGQLFASLLQRLRPGGGGPDWRGMEMLAQHLAAPGDPAVERVYWHFEHNLRDILTNAERAGIGVVLSTVAVNVRDGAPFQGTEGQTAATSPWLAPVEEALARGDRHTVQELLRQRLQAAPTDAEAHYLFGQVLEAVGELAAARRHYLDAVDTDRMKFRADTRINGLIRQAVVGRTGVMLVDAAKALGADRESAAPPAGFKLFLEHVHFSWRGNYALAALLAPAVSAQLFPGAGLRVARWLEEREAAAVLGYTPVGALTLQSGIEQLTARPPFTFQLDYARLRGRILREINTLSEQLRRQEVLAEAVNVVERAMTADPANPFLPFHLANTWLDVGQLDRALELNEQALKQRPVSAELLGQRGYILLQQGRLDEAENVLMDSVTREPHYYQTYELLSVIGSRRPDRRSGLEFFSGAVARLPQSATVRVAYARLLAAAGQTDEAAAQLEEVLRQAPDHPQALAALVDHLQARNERVTALEWLHRAFEYNPYNYTNNVRLLQMLEHPGEGPGMLPVMQAMSRSGPVTATLYLHMAQLLLDRGETREAVATLWRGFRAASDEGARELAEEMRQAARQLETAIGLSGAPGASMNGPRSVRIVRLGG
jgi:tetratricopeptide (TPR) repeat protein